MSPGLDSKFYSLTQYSTTAKNSQLFSFIALFSYSINQIFMNKNLKWCSKGYGAVRVRCIEGEIKIPKNKG